MVDTTSWRGATSNQRWNNVVYFNVGIYNVKQVWINVVYLNVDLNNVRQRQNSVVIFNVQFYNFGIHRNNVVKLTISKKNKTNHFKYNKRNSKFKLLFHILLHFTPHVKVCRRVYAKPQKFFKDHGRYCIART